MDRKILMAGAGVIASAGFDVTVLARRDRLLQAAAVVFLADGAHRDWEIPMNAFPGSVGIPDFYHACEHLAASCALLKSERTRKPTYEGLRVCSTKGRVTKVRPPIGTP